MGLHARHWRGGACWFVLVGGVLLAVLGRAVALPAGAPVAGDTAVPVATPTIDPRLVLQPRAVPLRTILQRGAAVRGTLYPGYPGRNTLRVVIQWQGRPLLQGTPLSLTVTMPGMAMTPARATLILRGAYYVGTVMLPMFGSYLAHVTIATPHGRVSGTLVLVLSLPRF